MTDRQMFKLVNANTVPSEGGSCGCGCGGEGKKERAEQVAAFQTDPDTKVFVGQLQTTGMGLTLTAGSVCVYYSLDFSYANYQQSMARVRRIGQTKRGVYIHLVCKDTIDEKVMGALKQKADVSKLLVDDYKKIIGG